MYFSASSDHVVTLACAILNRDADRAYVCGVFDGTAEDEWLACLEYCRANGILGIVGERLEHFGLDLVPETIRTTINSDRVSALVRYDIDRIQRREVLESLEAAGLQCIVLKGAALAHQLYSSPALRPTRDLDLLLRQDEVPRARAILEGTGFRAVGPKAAQHIPRMVRTMEGGQTFAVDVHFRLVPERVGGVRVVHPEGLWERTVELRMDWGSFRTLSPYDQVLHLHLHLFHHVFYNFRMMHLFDLLLAFRQWPDLDLERLGDDLDHAGLEMFRADMWTWAEAWFGDTLPKTRPHPDWAVVGRWLLRHGSLPLYAGLRYTHDSCEGVRCLVDETSRAIHRFTKAPGWGIRRIGR